MMFQLIIYILQMNQNKTIGIKTAYSQPASRYYRSVRYKINNSSVSKVQNFAHANTSQVERKDSRPLSTWHKPASYSYRKQSRTNGIFAVQNAQVSNNSQLKVTYMQTWDTLLNPLSKIKQDEDKNKAIRVCLPSIIDYDPSNFTSLDPLFLPFDHIQKGIIQLKKDLPAPKVEMSQIHSDMINFRQKIIKELQETKQYGIKEFARLRRMLRADKVQFQESNMRFRRYCQDLTEKDEIYRKDFEGTKPRLDVLQVQLFSNCPFDLARNPELDQQFPQEYF